MAERDYIFIAALRLKTNEAELVCRDRAKTCWWSWRTTPWTWLTLWAKLCSTLSPLAASVCGVLAETTAGQCPSTQVQIGTGLQPGSLVSATREVTDGPLLLIGELESSSIAVHVATDVSPSFSFFFFCVTQRFGILWRLSWQAQPSLEWACLLYTAALSWIVRSIADKRMPLPVWLLTISLFLSCCSVLNRERYLLWTFYILLLLNFSLSWHYTTLQMRPASECCRIQEFKSMTLVEFHPQGFCLCGSWQLDPSSEVSRFPLRLTRQEHSNQFTWNVLKGQLLPE